MNRKLWILVAALGVIGLLAASCSSDDGDVSAEATETAEATATEEATDEPTEAPTEEPTEAPTEAPTEEPTPEALPASFRGVTETAIKVGVAVPDFDALQAAGVSNYQGPADVAFQAFFDVINADGGIFGRQIEPVYVDFDFVSPVTQEEACTKFTQDEGVFIVLYGLLSNNNLCLTELNETMVMTRSFQTTELKDASGNTLWVQLNAVDDDRVNIMGSVIANSGRLDGKTIGILGSSTQSDGAEAFALADTLAELGFESQVAIAQATQEDGVAREAEYGIIGESFRANGVDYVFDLLGGSNATDVMTSGGLEAEFAYKALGASVDGSSDRSLMDGGVTVGEINEDAMWEDQEFWENCMNVVLDANPELAPEFEYLPDGDQQANGEPNWLNPTLIACNHTMLLKQLGEIAGAELTNDSFLAAMDELGAIDLHGYGQATFSQSKWDGLDEFYIQVYDFESDSIQFDGDAIVIDRS